MVVSGLGSDVDVEESGSGVIVRRRVMVVTVFAIIAIL